MPYIYQADLYCDTCGESIIRFLRAEGFEDNGDSDKFPQPCGFEKTGVDIEGDSPHHCGFHKNCLDPLILGGEEYGQLVTEQLTTEGRHWVYETHMEGPTPLTRYWMERFMPLHESIG